MCIYIYIYISIEAYADELEAESDESSSLLLRGDAHNARDAQDNSTRSVGKHLLQIRLCENVSGTVFSRVLGLAPYSHPQGVHRDADTVSAAVVSARCSTPLLSLTTYCGNSSLRSMASSLDRNSRSHVPCTVRRTPGWPAVLCHRS